MSYTCLLMVLCECACANLVSKANFNLINRTDLFICLHIMFQISFHNSKGQKSYCKFLGVRSELLLSIFVHDNDINFYINCVFVYNKIRTLIAMPSFYCRLILGKIESCH